MLNCMDEYKENESKTYKEFLDDRPKLRAETLIAKASRVPMSDDLKRESIEMQIEK